jgi:hypothetical protein
MDRRGTYIVIDGKQRLLSLRQFAADSSDPEFTPLALEGLDIRPDLNGLTLADLRADAKWADVLDAFENQTIRTVVVRNWADEDFLFLVFLRLNTGSVPLSPQELRQALHPGRFVEFADQFARENLAIHRALNVEPPDFRMRDVELLVRYFAFDRFLGDYAGQLKPFLDLTCSRLNDQWAEDEAGIRTDADRCVSAIEATESIFGNGAFKRWTGQRWESRFNRAVFDVMTYYFKDRQLAEAAREHRTDVVGSYKRLSDRDSQFVQSIQTTTKSVGATHTRLARWGVALGETLGIDVAPPVLAGNRIQIR